MRRSTTLALFTMALAIAGEARAQVVVPLDRGVALRGVEICAVAGEACAIAWEPIGFSFGDHPELTVASAVAMTSTGRIVAMVPRDAERRVGIPARFPTPPRVLYTDDLGATWREGVWPDTRSHATAIAFDPRTDYGVAIDEAGRIWSSDDGGLTWRSRRSATGVGFRGVWVRGHTVLVEDARGALWISRDGGFSLESLAPSGTVRADGELEIDYPRGTVRIDERGRVRRR